MNKKVRAAAVAAISIFLLLLSGCASSSFDNSELLRPPRTTGDKARIQEIIEEKAGGDYTLKYPKNGSYRSAIINEDLDGDDVDEAIVFYRPSNKDESTHILIIKNFGGELQDIGDYASGSPDVDRVELGDVSGTGTKDIVVGWSDQTGSLCTLNAYIVREKTTAELKIEETYSQFMLADMTDEGKTSIMLFSTSSQSSDANAKMLQYDGESKKIFTRSSVAMSNLANSYVNIIYGKATKSQSGIFVDSQSVNGESETQFIYWDKESSNLVNPLNTQNSDKVSTNPTLRSFSVALCSDINGDGIIDVPTTKALPHNNNENIELVAVQSTWNSYNPSNNKLSAIIDTVTNTEQGYYFIIPDEWKGKYTARLSVFGNSLTFYLWNPAETDDNGDDEKTELTDNQSGSLGDKLLTIQIFSAQEWVKTKSKDYIEVGDYGNIVYTVNIPAETDNTKGIAMSLNKIPQYFKLTNK